MIRSGVPDERRTSNRRSKQSPMYASIVPRFIESLTAHTGRSALMASAHGCRGLLDFAESSDDLVANARSFILRLDGRRGVVGCIVHDRLDPLDAASRRRIGDIASNGHSNSRSSATGSPPRSSNYSKSSTRSSVHRKSCRSSGARDVYAQRSSSCLDGDQRFTRVNAHAREREIRSQDEIVSSNFVFGPNLSARPSERTRYPQRLFRTIGAFKFRRCTATA
jgi:hypothetical protein